MVFLVFIYSFLNQCFSVATFFCKMKNGCPVLRPSTQGTWMCDGTWDAVEQTISALLAPCFGSMFTILGCCVINGQTRHTFTIHQAPIKSPPYTLTHTHIHARTHTHITHTQYQLSHISKHALKLSSYSC